MEGYLMTLISVSLLSGIVGMISPEGDTKKYVRLVSLLCLLCAMVGPALSLFGDSELSLDGLLGESKEETVNYDEIYNNTLIYGGERQAEETIHSSIVKEFDLPADSLEIRVRTESKNDTEPLVEVTVILRNQAIFADPKKIVAQIESMMDCRCTVFYE